MRFRKAIVKAQRFSRAAWFCRG